jgi:hypothetical protein
LDGSAKKTDVVEELRLHNHPTSRVMNKTTGRQRNADETREELINHYNYKHKIKINNN